MNNIDALVEKKAKEQIILRRKLFVIEWIEKFPGNVSPSPLMMIGGEDIDSNEKKGWSEKNLLPDHIQKAKQKKLKRKYKI